VFNDTEEIGGISDPSDYAVICESGLTMREDVQNMQDWCIKINVLYSQEIWCTPNNDAMQKIKEMLERNGFGIFY
jgi:hypothetical protein